MQQKAETMLAGTHFSHVDLYIVLHRPALKSILHESLVCAFFSLSWRPRNEEASGMVAFSFHKFHIASYKMKAQSCTHQNKLNTEMG